MSNEYKDWRNDLTETQRNNLDLCHKYPILIPKNAFTGKEPKDYDWDFTMLSSIPAGWRMAFGKEWAREIQEAIDKLPEEDREKIYILQLKEKYGIFTQYFSHYTDELNAVIRKYEALSKRTCINCGKPATRMSTGWISPWCDDCAEKVKDKHIPIEEFLKEWESED